MPRLSRLDAPGMLHHVMGRGIDRKKIFISDIDGIDSDIRNINDQGNKKAEQND